MSPKILELDRLAEIAELRHEEFVRAEPYHHVVIDDFLPPSVAQDVRNEFSRTRAGWDHYYHYNQRKLAITDLDKMGPSTRGLVEELQSRGFLRFLEKLTGLEGLLADTHLDGAGMHQTLPGGHLNIHTDFLAHPIQKTWSRELNVIIYFNGADWKDDWMGNLEMWDRSMTRAVQSILPSFNRCVVFRTSGDSWHGHPHPLTCPPDETRKSLALYYFKERPTQRDLQPTAYRARPEDSLVKSLLITADTGLLKLYSMLRRHAGLKDTLISRILRFF